MVEDVRSLETSTENSGALATDRDGDGGFSIASGGGDSFASGFIYGLMTTPGDTSLASKEEVEKLMKRDGARVQR
jgi:2-dehydro-3-deoxygluconokinase